MSIEVLPHIFKEAERQLAELKTAKKATLTQTFRKAVQQIVPLLFQYFQISETMLISVTLDLSRR
jgi:hypothetical protein